MILHNFMKIEDLPKDLQDYAKDNNILEIKDFTVNKLYDLFGDVGFQLYISRLTTNRKFMVRVISENFKDKSPTELHKEFKISFNYAYSLWHEAHKKINVQNNPKLF